MSEPVAGVVAARPNRLFYLGTALTIAVAVVVGFADTYYLKPLFDAPALPFVLHVHGVVFSAWLALFVIQTSLIRSRSIALHRRLGFAGVGLAVLMLIVGTVTVLIQAPLRPDPNFVYVVALGDLVMFGAFVGAAVYLRRRAETHKRLMLLATLAIIDAGIFRWPGLAVALPGITGLAVTYVLVDLFVVAGVVYDLRKRGSVHPAFAWGGGLLVASEVLRLLMVA